MGWDWASIPIGDKPADVLQLVGEKPRFGLLFLHDLDGVTIRNRSVWGRHLNGSGIACVSPHGGPCWWADRVCPAFGESLTPERYMTEQVHMWMRREWGLSPGNIALVGVGMGGQGVLRIGFKHAQRFPVVAALGAALDQQDAYGLGTPLDEMYPSREHCRQDSAILHIHPVRQPTHLWFAADPCDPWYRGNDHLHEKLGALGVAHTFDSSAVGSGSGWDYYDRMAGAMFAFLVKALEAESRRLL